jgi:glycosyltransferase involved in cell wall biosynthesis
MAYNEESTIREVYQEVQNSLRDIGGKNEIIVVDDGSSDGTKEAISMMIEDSINDRAISYSSNRGLGSVYRTGFDEAKGKFVTFFPADGQFPASEIKDFYKLNLGADLVLGYLPQLKRSVVSIILSKIERLMYKFLLGPMPRFQGLFMFRREILERFELVSEGRGWGVVMEFIIRVSRNGGVIKSLPGTTYPRKVGKSKVNNLETMWSNLKQIFYLRKVL